MTLTSVESPAGFKWVGETRREARSSTIRHSYGGNKLTGWPVWRRSLGPQWPTSQGTSYEARIWARAQGWGPGRSREGEEGRLAYSSMAGRRKASLGRVAVGTCVFHLQQLTLLRTFRTRWLLLPERGTTAELQLSLR